MTKGKQMAERIAIIGAGMAGIACARALVAAGHAPVILDKGRGVGGRMATRRLPALGVQFDHGAQYVSARDPAFAAVLAGLEQTGGAARWDIGTPGTRHVGLPGMSGLARALAEGLDIRSGVQVSAVAPQGNGWRLDLPKGAALFDRVVITAPAAQAAALLPAGHALAAQIAAARHDPCLTLMAAFPADTPRPFVAEADEHAPLSWIAQDSAKPGRPEGAAVAWVAQAGPDWSRAQLELAPEDIAARMLPLLAARIGVDAGRAVHAVAHRWRYARVAQALGLPFLRDAGGRVYAGGDWCLGARVEAAWQSGTAIAADILAG